MTTPDTPPTPTAPAAGAVASGRVARLAAEAATAAQLRALTTDPDVIAWRVEKVRTQIDALLWAGIVLGLGFTMVNVQTFAAAGAPSFSPGWWVAWLLDPMVSLVLLAVLRAEQVTARYQVSLPAWARRTKWLTFAATYVMNTWTSWGLTPGQGLSWSGVVLHSVPPLVVFATAETGPGLRDRLTEAVHHALTEAPPGSQAVAVNAAPTPGPAVHGSVHERTDRAVQEPVHEPGGEPVHEPAATDPVDNSGEPAAPAARSARQPAPPRRRTGRGKTPAPAPARRLLGDYVAAARTALHDAEQAGAPVSDPSPGWCRSVTGCSAGTSVKVAATLRTTPDPSTSARHEEAA